MKIEIQITNAPILGPAFPETLSGNVGALVEFSGVVRALENGETISALEYEAYLPMAANQLRQILEMLAQKHPCHAAKVIHRLGIIPVGETAIYVGIIGQHRGEALALLMEFMNQLKLVVPIWKVRAHKKEAPLDSKIKTTNNAPKSNSALPPLNFTEALAKINRSCSPLSGERIHFTKAHGRVLRETVLAQEDFPDKDRSTRDGFAILVDDVSESFLVVDTLHAADWKPRQLKKGEAVRVATGAALPCENVRVVMQENVARHGDALKILRAETSLNIRQRGEELRRGDVVLSAGSCLNAGALALLATAGCTLPLVNPKLKVLHLTTGDEIISPEKTLLPGQIRDSNSILMRTLLENLNCEVAQKHLPEDFEMAKQVIATFQRQLSTFNLILVSGGASVGDKDFTRPLLEWLGFEIDFNRVNIRPGAPLIFGKQDSQMAFGLPGNPLSHWVCFHLFVAAAIAKMSGTLAKDFVRGTLVTTLGDALNSRETFWPARYELRNGKIELEPLRWRSSGDVTALAQTNALLRVPANRTEFMAGTVIDFLPTNL